MTPDLGPGIAWGQRNGPPALPFSGVSAGERITLALTAASTGQPTTYGLWSSWRYTTMVHGATGHAQGENIHLGHPRQASEHALMHPGTKPIQDDQTRPPATAGAQSHLTSVQPPPTGPYHNGLRSRSPGTSSVSGGPAEWAFGKLNELSPRTFLPVSDLLERFILMDF